jgi:pimeloyl-ACP methyl ester carboxylesterase
MFPVIQAIRAAGQRKQQQDARNMPHTGNTPGPWRWSAVFSGFCALALLLAVWMPAALADEEAVQIIYQKLHLNGRLVGAGTKTPTRPVVLIVHGTLGHLGMEIIANLQNLLDEREIDSLAITLSLRQDNRTGMYDCATPHNHRHDGALGEIAAWRDWLKNRGYETIHLLGHSRGGAQAALFMAERQPADIRKLVLLAPMTWNDTRAAAGYEKRYGKKLAPLLEKARAEPEAMMTATDFIYCPAATVRGSSFLSYYADDPRRHTPALLPKTRLPVLVIAAADDKVVRGLPEQVRPLADGERVRLVVIEEAGHMFLDFALEDAADAMADFLKG